MSDEGGFVQVGLCGLLVAVFITLKVIGEITWPWIWVFCPIWIPAIIVIGVLIIFTLACGITDGLRGFPSRRRFVC